MWLLDDFIELKDECFGQSSVIVVANFWPGACCITRATNANSKAVWPFPCSIFNYV